MIMSEKSIDAFIQSDKSGHLKRSGEALRQHARETGGYSGQERRDYFFGIMEMFPMMFLGHYYGWLIGQEPHTYMEEFVPAQQKKYEAMIRSLLETLCGDGPELESAWPVLLGAYLASVPAELLRSLVRWGFGKVELERTEAFLTRECAKELPQLLFRAAQCRNAAQREELVFWLGTEYPFELVARFHRAVME